MTGQLIAFEAWALVGAYIYTTTTKGLVDMDMGMAWHGHRYFVSRCWQD